MFFEEQARLDHAVEDVEAGGGFEEQIDADDFGFADFFFFVDGMKKIIPFRFDVGDILEGQTGAGALDSREAANAAATEEEWKGGRYRGCSN